MDDQFVDVDFTKDAAFVLGDLGRNQDKLLCGAADDAVPLVPENEWRGLAEKIEAENSGLDQLVTRIFNQGQEGACVGHAATQQHQVMQAVQFGKNKVVQLSPMSLYKRLGRTASSGAMIDDALEEVTARGILPLSTSQNRAQFGNQVMPETGFDNRMPRGWEQTAKLFRASERLIVESEASLFSCLFRGHPVVVGRQGHSILYLRPVFKNGRWLIKYVNSWSENWGEGGFGYDSASLFRESARWAFAVRSIVVPSNVRL